MCSRQVTYAVVFTLLAGSATAWAGPIQTFTDFDQFLAAAGDVHEIDFETLPDGNPSYYLAEITPEFNYAAQGVEFFSHAPDLRICGNDTFGFCLRAGPQGSEGPPNWIIAELVHPARAVGIVFPGHTSLSLYTTGNDFLGTWHWGGGGYFFLGAVSEQYPIGSVVVNRGYNFEAIESFHFAPVPEPGSVILLSVVGVVVAARRHGLGPRQ